MLLVALCGGCSQHTESPPAKMEYSGKACQIYRSYANARFINLEGRFDNGVEFPKMLRKAKPYFPLKYQESVGMVEQYLQELSDNATDPKALAAIRSEKKWKGIQNPTLGLIGLFITTCTHPGHVAS